MITGTRACSSGGRHLLITNSRKISPPRAKLDLLAGILERAKGYIIRSDSGPTIKARGHIFIRDEKFVVGYGNVK